MTNKEQQIGDYKMKKMLIAAAALMMTSTVLAEEVMYRVTFKGNFSKQMQPHSRFPGNPHFSALVVAGHKRSYDMFGFGKKSTPGVKLVAETGGTKTIVQELLKLRDNGRVLEYRRASSGTSGLGTMSLNVRVDSKNPYLSAITMIAPSPDWIVGVSKYSLKKNGKFITKKVVPLHAIDAGTDSGTGYTSGNKPTRPQAKIAKLKSVSGQDIQAPYGYLTIEKL